MGLCGSLFSILFLTLIPALLVVISKRFKTLNEPVTCALFVVRRQEFTVTSYLRALICSGGKMRNRGTLMSITAFEAAKETLSNVTRLPRLILWGQMVISVLRFLMRRGAPADGLGNRIFTSTLIEGDECII